MDPETTNGVKPGHEQISTPDTKENESATVQKIQELLRTKNDTSRFVGLALLKSVLDNSQQVREDESTITGLWRSVSPKFLDRLLWSGSKKSSKDAKEMIEIAVAVLHTFSILLPEATRTDPNLIGRIPALVSVVLHSSIETTQLIVQTLLTLVSNPEGARIFIAVDDVSPLIETAPSQPLVLDVFLYTYAQPAVYMDDMSAVQSKIDQAVHALVVSFKGTDGITLLTFLDQLLRRLDPEVIPPNPSWLKASMSFIRSLVTKKPTPAGRAAYTNIAASMLQVYPAEASRSLFFDDVKSEKPFFYLLVNLVLIDLRSSLPTLLQKLNSPDYGNLSQRLASAFDVLSVFTGTLIRYLDGEDDDSAFSPSLMAAPDLLLKLRNSITETISLAIEYLRDRWDASVTGAMGLHPDARTGAAETFSGSHYTLAWDSKTDIASQDPLILATIRALALWVSEDDNDSLRKEAAGLSDMFLDLYKSSASGRLDFRRAVLMSLEGVVMVEQGVSALLEHEGWEILTKDMLAILQGSTYVSDEVEAARGIEIVRVLMLVVEREQPGSREAWMAVLTAVAAWDVPDIDQAPVVLEFQAAVLQLVTALLVNSHAGMQRRYAHSISAVLGITGQLNTKVKGDAALVESLEDVEHTLGSLR